MCERENKNPGAALVVRVVALFAILLGSGCGDSMLAHDSNAGFASTCVTMGAELKAKQQYSIQDKCESISSYVCETNTSSSGSEQQCTTVSGMGQVCLTIDADKSRSGPFHCSNIELSGTNGYAFQAVGATLSEALEGVVAKCRTGTL